MIQQVFRARGWFEENKLDGGVNHQSGAQDLLRVTQHAGRKPYSSMFDWGIYFPILAQCVRLRKFQYPQVSGSVIQDYRFKNAIRQAADESWVKPTTNSHEEETPSQKDDIYQKILKRNEKRAMSIMIDMRSKLSDLLLRITSWILYKLLPCFLSGVVAHTNQIEMLKAATERAPGVPLIFLPLHRSHLDYIMVSFILLNNDIRSPIVAAGNNLRIPLFGALLRGLGAFFIKRKIDPVVGKKDIIYRAALHLYLQHALKAGHNVEFFIEGGRTRTGKPCMPKNGILSVIVNAFMDGTIVDALLVPVSVNYERLVDGNFVREQLGQKKQPETFKSAMSAIWKVLNSKYGLMRIDFNEPFSIRELVQSFNKIAKEAGIEKEYRPATRQLQHNQSSSSLYGTDIVCEEHRSLVDSISRHVVYDCASATSVMTTNAIAFLLLNRFRDGVYESVLVQELDNLIKTLKGKKDLGFSGDSLHIAKYACDLLGPSLVTLETNNNQTFIKPKIELPNVIELTYYANTLSPHFALESVVITSLYTLLQKSVKDEGVLIDQLKEACLDHCDTLRYEFIFNKPTQNLEMLLDETIDNLCTTDIITIPQLSNMDETTIMCRRLANHIDGVLDEDDKYNEDIEERRVLLTPNKTDDQNALLAVLAPYGHTYLAVTCTLKTLLGNSIIENQFIQLCLEEIQERVKSKNCTYAESVSTESIKNCIKLLEKWDVIEISNLNGIRLLSLGNMYNSSLDIENIISRMRSVVPPPIKI